MIPILACPRCSFYPLTFAVPPLPRAVSFLASGPLHMLSPLPFLLHRSVCGYNLFQEAFPEPFPSSVLSQQPEHTAVTTPVGMVPSSPPVHCRLLEGRAGVNSISLMPSQGLGTQEGFFTVLRSGIWREGCGKRTSPPGTAPGNSSLRCYCLNPFLGPYPTAGGGPRSIGHALCPYRLTRDLLGSAKLGGK